ncbi:MULTISPECIES: hypothetical protein [Bradyrhizobium]|uniref:hypothetical protein n=1 Tax=Bradyrhizobium TaxID=374 RepID=UPI001FCE0EA1|nr:MULTISPECIES: hypothetical protein [Bradyrhizobium]
MSMGDGLGPWQQRAHFTSNQQGSSYSVWGATSGALKSGPRGRSLGKGASQSRSNMQIHPKAYLQFISRIWHSRVLPPRDRNPTSRDASPLLIYIAAVLALLLAILIVDRHGAPFQLPEHVGDPAEINPIFMNF